MPPNKPQIPQRELNLIERWIMSGLADEMKAGASNPQESSKQKDTLKSQQEMSESRIVSTPQPAYSPLRPIPQLFAVRAMSAHPNEPIVAVASLHQVAILDTRTAIFEKQAIEIGQRNISALRFSPDGRYLLIGVGIIGESGNVLVLDLSTKQWLPSVGEEPDNIQSIDCNSDASQIAIGTTSRTVKIFDRTTQSELHLHRKHTDWVVSLAYSFDGLLLASGDRLGGIHVWEAESGNLFATLRGHTSGISGLAWTSDGNQLISSSLDGSIRVWDMHTFETTRQFVAHDRGVLSLSSGPQGSILSTGRDGWIRQWSMESSKPEWQSQLPDEAIAICRNGETTKSNVSICSDASGGLYLFEIPTVQASENVKCQAVSLPVHPQQRVFATNLPAAIKRSSMANSKTQSAVPSDKGLVPPSNPARQLEDSELPVGSDLEESRKALASIENSLEQTYRTAEQLEEAKARLKQMIAIQEARQKQAELRRKSSQN